MSHSWAKKLISVTTAVSLAAALVVGVFSQSHAALSADTQADAQDPCAEHIVTSAGALPADNCGTLCFAADLNHLLGVVIDRTQLPEPVAVVVSYDLPTIPSFQPADVFPVKLDRGPPGIDLYLLTQRLRL